MTIPNNDLPAARRRFREVLERVALVLASLLLTLLALEGGVRLLLSAQGPGGTQYQGFLTALAIRRHPLFPYDGPGLIQSSYYRYRPYAQFSTEYPSNPRGTFDLHNRMNYRLNAQGFRGPDFVRQRTPGVLRVAVLGDSFAFGEGLRDPDPYPAVLERSLREAGVPAEVYNFGVNGYGVHDESLLLEEILGYLPDVIVWGYLLNDIDRYRLTKFTDDLGRRKETLFWLRTPLRSVNLLAGRVWDRHVDRRTRRFYHELYDSPESWGELSRLVAGMAERCRRWKIPVLAAIFPEMRALSERPYPFAEINARLTALFRGAGIISLDLTEPLGQAGGSRLTVHPADPHPDEEAHRVAAREILAALERDILVPPR